jgi:hypothetical protein
VEAPWRRYPFPLNGPETFPWNAGSFTLSAIPQRHELISVAYEPSLEESLPQAIRNVGPARWKSPPGVRAVRWHDWKSNDWRLVESFANSTGVHLAHRAVLTHTWPEEGESVLQSWPLPPRDPKWPALCVAVLCSAATWWVFARRYRAQRAPSALATGS